MARTNKFYIFRQCTYIMYVIKHTLVLIDFILLLLTTTRVGIITQNVEYS
jgi:hypothetical protein